MGIKSMNILDIEMQKNDANAKTIRDYLKALLTKLWTEGEGFSGKRPFGNSGWEFEIYTALIKAGAVDGKLDQDGYLDKVDDMAANKLIFEAIESLQ
jgi:hypothetical protein